MNPKKFRNHLCKALSSFKEKKFSNFLRIFMFYKITAVLTNAYCLHAPSYPIPIMYTGKVQICIFFSITDYPRNTLFSHHYNLHNDWRRGKSRHLHLRHALVFHIGIPVSRREEMHSECNKFGRFGITSLRREIRL